MISIIAAVARNRVIGAANRLPWYLPDDLKYFKRVTGGHPIVMGRKTYESIGAVAPGARKPGGFAAIWVSVPGARMFTSVRDACLAPPADGSEASEVFVIGGAEIYEQAMGLADRLYLTEIEFDFMGDTFFPEYPRTEFREVSREKRAPDPDNGSKYAYAFVVLERVQRT